MNTITMFYMVSIFLMHWLGDFVLQTRWMAENKSKRWDALLLHTAIYSLIWIGLIPNLTFVLVTFISHTLIDYVTSRINAKLWQTGKTKQFFVMIGFDQFLHYSQIFLTLYLI